MKKYITFIFILGLTINLFGQNISFDDLRDNYERVIYNSDFDNLKNFSTALDLFIQSSEFNSLKKHEDYRDAFYELNKTTKFVLGKIENPWEINKNSDLKIGSTKLIDEKFYYFVLVHNSYVTKRMIFYRIFFSITITVILFTSILIFLILNYKKEKKENLYFTQAMLRGQEVERKRISEELHDTIAQNLKVQKLQILNTIVKSKDGTNINNDLEDILEKTKSNISEIRTICQNLFPPDFQQQKLDWMIAELCDNIKKNAGINCSYFCDSESPFTLMEEEKKLHVFRIIQEALNNAVAHSECSKIQLFITKKELIISDNGKGFNYQEVLASETKHFGLRSMKERAMLLNTSMEIKSDKTGTNITFKLS